MLYKQVIVVRKDIKMSCGKISAQVAHGSVTLVLEILESNNELWRKWLEEWVKEGQKKVVLKVDTLDELLEVHRRALELGLPCALIRDAGLTEVPPDTITVVAIGPAPSEIVDRVTGHLKLL